MRRLGGVYIGLSLVMVSALLLSGCDGGKQNSSNLSPSTKTPITSSLTTTYAITSYLPATTTLPLTGAGTPITPLGSTTMGPLAYPFEGKNMFFGLSIINPLMDAAEVKELGISWLSLEPHVTWFSIEQTPGVYSWSDLDGEIKILQSLGLDITMVLSPIINAFGAERQQVMAEIAKYPSLGHWLREGNAGELKLYPHDETIPIWVNFVKAAVERYDGDGQGDMPGLKYACRNWHFVEEYPCPELEDNAYLDLLKTTYTAVKSVDPQAKVILAGLAGNFTQYFAYMDGYIIDEDAGVQDSVKHTRVWWNANPFWKNAKKTYENILDQGRNYFDIVDIHTYVPEESYFEGEIDYIQKTMQKLGYQKPLWIIEGGGPFKNYPGKPAVNSPGDPYYGWGSEKENAEFVIKLQAMAAAKGVEREHWGLNEAEDGYWDGPWEGMPMVDSAGYKKPSYWTFKLMREKLENFVGVIDLSQSNLRIFDFKVGGKDVYIIWSSQGTSSTVDLSSVLGNRNITITHIVTELDGAKNPIYPSNETKSSKSVPVGLTPIFVE